MNEPPRPGMAMFLRNFPCASNTTHALIVAVGGVDAALRVDGHAVDHRHLAVALPLLAAEDAHELSFRRELDDALVGVAVGDEDVAIADRRQRRSDD